MNENNFVDEVVRVARSMGYPIEINREGKRQIDFGHKKLHEGHLRQLYPEILLRDASVSRLIDKVAPGRPCAHRPMKLILHQLHG